MSNLSGAFIGSCVGGVIGGAAWIGVGWATGYELGILAVGVGIAVGIGAAIGAKGRAGTAGGIVAALIAIASIVTARYVLLQMAIEKGITEARAEFGDAIPGPEDAEYWTSFIADRIVNEREEAGETIDWPYVDDDQEGNIAGAVSRRHLDGGSKGLGTHSGRAAPRVLRRRDREHSHGR